jgi:hypothetical protein
MAEIKMVVIVRDDLPVWKRVNMTAFLASGIAAVDEGATGGDYVDKTGTVYYPMFWHPVNVLEASLDQLRRVAERARTRGVRVAMFTSELFDSPVEANSLRIIGAIDAADLDLTGLAIRADPKTVDKIVKGVSRHP